MEVVLSQFIGYNLKAADGLLGTVRDFCFDDRSWKIQYLVIDTNDWDREILISPFVLLQPDVASKTFPVKITRRQIYLNLKIDSTTAIVETERVERGQPYRLKEASQQPVLVMTTKNNWRETKDADNHYKRTQDVCGSVIRSLDLVLGKIFDHIIEDTNWQIRYLVIRIDKSISQKHLLVDCKNLNNIRWSDGVVELNL
jgi:hypothetical protein